MRKHLHLLVFACVLNACTSRSSDAKLSELLGIDHTVIEEEVFMEEIPGIGEGYSLQVLLLSKETVEAFEASVARPRSFPIGDSGWHYQTWQHGPLAIESNAGAEMALSSWLGYPEVNAWIEKMRQATESKQAYFAFRCRPDNVNPVEGAFQTLDIPSRTLYLVEFDL